MPVQKECILAMAAETKKDASQRDYVSEGLFMTCTALDRGETLVRRVVSTDILGPSWFTEDEREFSAGLYTAPGSVTYARYRDAVDKSDILTLQQMRNKTVDPSWRLSEKAAGLLSDTGFLKHTPILNILNGFEIIMDNVLRAAAEMAHESSGGYVDADPASLLDKRVSIKVDASLILRRGNVSMADLALGRARRAVAVLSYALIDILNWKWAVSAQLSKTGVASIATTPPNAPYGQLVRAISERAARFINGLDAKPHVVGENGKKYVVPCISTVLTAVVASAGDGFTPRVSGAFYESLYGYEIMSQLYALVAVEIKQVLTRATKSPEDDALEKYVVADPAVDIPSNSVTEEEKIWIKKERERRNAREDWQAAAEEAVARVYPGIDFRPILNPAKDELITTAISSFHREIKRDLDARGYDTPISEAVERVCSPLNRQYFFSNYSVMRARPGNSAARFSMHVMWNALFLATGGVTSSVAASVNGVRSRLLLQFFLKDLHSLFNCMKCEMGFVTKILDTFSILEIERESRGVGELYLKRVLGEALKSLIGNSNNAPSAIIELSSVGTIIESLLSSSNGLKSDTDTASGKARQQLEDNKIKRLSQRDPVAFARECSLFVNVSKGFAALAFYCLYAAAASTPPIIITKTDDASKLRGLDAAVVLLMSRWGRLSFPSPNVRVSKPQNGALVAFAGVWALRNAVRARRNVANDGGVRGGVYLRGGGGEIPGRPMSLAEALPFKVAAVVDNEFMKKEFIDNHKLWQLAINEMQSESEVWISAGRKRPTRGIKLSNVKRAELLTEPSGVIPTTSSERVSKVLFPPKKTTSDESRMARNQLREAAPEKTPLHHPLSVIGEISLSLKELNSFTKETFSKLPILPITALDRV